MKKNNVFNIIIKCWIDYALIIFGFIVIYILDSKSIIIFQNLPERDKLLSFISPLLLTIMPIIVTAAVLVYQIYYNRYTLRELQNKIKSEFIVLSALLIIEIALMFIYWLDREASYLLYYLQLYYIIYIMVRLFIFIFKYNQLSIKYYVKDIYKSYIKSIENGSISKSKIEDILNDLNEYFVESLEKKENNYIRAIIDIKENIFIKYFENMDKIIISKNDNKDLINDLEKIGNKFSKSISKDYKNIIRVGSNNIIFKRYNDYIIKIIFVCIDCEKEIIYNKIVEELFFMLSYEDDNINSKIFKNIMYIYNKVYDKLLEDCCDNKWEEKIENEVCNSLIVAEILLNNNINIKEIIINSFDMLDDKMKKCSNEEYSMFYNHLIEAIMSILKYIDKTESEFFVIALSRHFDTIKEKNNQEIFDEYVESIFSIVKKSLYSKNKELVLKLGYLISEILNGENQFKKNEKYSKMRCECILRCLEVYPDISIVYFPKYSDEIKGKIDNQTYIKELSDNFSEIFDKLLRVDDIETIYFFLESLNECIELFSQMHRAQQEYMINVYEEILTDCIIYKTFKNFNLSLYKFNSLLKTMDEQDKISENLLYFIFDKIDSVGRYITDEKDSVIQEMYLHNLIKLAEDMKIIEKNKKYKEKVIEVLFNFGIEAVEIKNENLLKQCSNNLGWYGKKLIDNGDIENFKKIIDYTANLYNLVVDQEFDNSIKAFLGTLFIILGAYTYSQKNYMAYNYVKKQIITLKDVTPIKTSKRLREYGHKYWDKIFDSDSKRAINEFYETLKI